MSHSGIILTYLMNDSYTLDVSYQGFKFYFGSCFLIFLFFIGIVI